jgi:23S rRNA (uracil1939-C5)-methyltransferase
MSCGCFFQALVHADSQLVREHSLSPSVGCGGGLSGIERSIIRITDLAWGGQGLGRFEGKVVFVPFTLPGELVEIEITGSKKNYSQGNLFRLLEASPDRIDPPCFFYRKCGGCQLQHLDPLKQIQEKEKLFRQGMNHALGQKEILIKPALPSTQTLGYRHRLYLKSAWNNDRFIMGFYKAGSHEVVPITHCLLANGEINKLLPHLQDIIQGLRYTQWTPEIEIQIIENPFRGGLVFISPEGLTADKRKKITEGLRSQTRLEYILFQESNKPGWRSEHPFSKEKDSPEFELPAAETGLSRDLKMTCFPQVFTQINLALNRRLIAELADLDLFDLQDRVLDLYCGLGNFSLPLSLMVEEVLGLEVFPLAASNARWNQKRNQITNCKFVQAKAEEVFKQALWQNKLFSKVFLDPPRSGAREVVSWLDTPALRGILYLSCNPMTLFRDLKLLMDKGWRVEWTRPIDFFPQTFHLESLTYLSRK